MHDHNSWNGAVTITSDDFVSLDTTLLDNARVNYYLPKTTFGTLAASSDAINAGVDVGLPYISTARIMSLFIIQFPQYKSMY